MTKQVAIFLLIYTPLTIGFGIHGIYTSPDLTIIGETLYQNIVIINFWLYCIALLIYNLCTGRAIGDDIVDALKLPRN